MKKHIILWAFCLACGGSLFAQGANDIQTVATVTLTKTEFIPVKQLRNRVEAIEKASGQTLTLEQRREILDGMIDELLVLQAAARDHVSIEDGLINQQMEEIRAQLAQQIGRRPTDAEFAQAIKDQTNLDLAGFREQLKKQLTFRRYLFEKKGSLIQSIKEPTSVEIENEYKEMKNTSEGIAQLTQDETVQFIALVFPYENDSEKAKARSGAENLSKEINGSVNKFDEKGGQQNVSYRTTSNIIQKNKRWETLLGKKFMDTVFSLKYDPKSGATEVSPVLDVESGNARGFYIIKVTGKYPFKSPLALDDTMLQYNTTVRELVKRALMAEKEQALYLQAQQELVDDLRKGKPFQVNDQYINY
ncbi:MAG: SurA N-terminal domain-containing protein [Spirochaetaceae bacterium]|jgi:hypothetical protein|nr:SurA N-terminal domain-containing protein [Spirochaetaceae bacterium]